LNWLRLLAFAALLILIFPIVALVYWGLGPLYSPVGFSRAVFNSIILTLVSSGIAVIAEVLIFTPLAYYLARSQNSLAETLVDIPASIPHPIIGVALLVLDSPLTPTGRFLLALGINFFDSILGLVVALTVISAPIYVKAMQPFFSSMSMSHENYALGLGASRMKTFLQVVVPNSFRGITSASLIALSRAMSEFGSIAILAYVVLDAPAWLAGSSPASVLIFQYYGYSGLNAAVTASSVLVLISIPIMVALRLVQGTRWRAAANRRVRVEG
jgi:molybdate/tungstate transport system permease protein